jgi:GDP-L-fucose synthase
VNLSSRIFVAGGETLIGSAIIERLGAEGCRNLVGAPPDEPDLTVAAQVDDFFGEARPEYVFLAAGRSGGIRLNQTCPADLMLHNLLVTAHVLDAAHHHKVAKLLYLASSCSYPREAPQPLAVESLLAGPPEPTNAAYATAKLAGWQLCDAYRRQHGRDFVTAIPANPFGPGDDFSPDGGHVIPALIRKMHESRLAEAPSVTVWGSGRPRREFIYARDMADACLFVMRQYDGPAPINLGSGVDLSIAELAQLVARVVGYRGKIRFDAARPDGMPLKMLESGPLRALGWRASADFMTALAETYDWFLQHEVKEDTRDAPATVSVPLPHPAG